MHHTDCCCPRCHTVRAADFGSVPSRFDVVGGFSPELENPLSEAEEMELAMELLSVSNEDEWEQFLGKLFKGIGRGLKKVGSFVGKRLLSPLGGALKALAKTALPFVGGALGSLIPIPGVGTAIGTALGSAVSKALELESSGRDLEDAELDVARRFVRIAASAAQRAAAAPASVESEVVVRQALLDAVRAHLPNADLGERRLRAGTGLGEPRSSGGWVRHGRQITVLGA